MGRYKKIAYTLKTQEEASDFYDKFSSDYIGDIEKSEPYYIKLSSIIGNLIRDSIINDDIRAADEARAPEALRSFYASDYVSANVYKACQFHETAIACIKKSILQKIPGSEYYTIPKIKIPQLQRHPYYKLSVFFEEINWKVFLRQFNEGIDENELSFLNNLLAEEDTIRSNSTNSGIVGLGLPRFFLEAIIDLPVLRDALLSGLTESNLMLIFRDDRGASGFNELLEMINSDEFGNEFKEAFFRRFPEFSSITVIQDEKSEKDEAGNYPLATVGSNFRVLGARPQSAGSKKAAATTAEADSFDHDVAENPSQASSRPPSPSPFG